MNKKLTRNFLGCVLAALLTSPAISPALAEEVDEIVISATGIPTPLAQIGSSVDIITAEDLERQQITYLQDALKTVAGISTYRSGGPGTTSNVFLRGMTSKYSAVYVDGVQINDPVSQQAAWGNLPAHGLESIEVLRGSQGVLYGSEAIGGAINMFTAVGGENEISAEVDAGSFNTQNVSLSGRGQAGYIDYGFSIQKSDTDGFSAANEDNGNSEDDGYESLSARGRVIYDLSDQWSVDVALRSISSEVETDGGFSTPVDVNQNYTDFDAVGGSVSVNYNAVASQHRLSIGESEDVSSSYTWSSFSSTLGEYTSTGARDSLNYRGTWRLTPELQVLLGFEQESETYEVSNAQYDIENEAAVGLLQYSADGGLSASVAIRQDDNDVFGSFDTYRIAGKQMFGAFGLRISHGTGFRAPSLYELYGESDYCVANVCGNTALSPEESESNDIAVIFQPNSRLQIELASFDIQVTDTIEYGSVAPANGADPCLGFNSYPGFTATTCGKYEQSNGESKSTGYEFRLAQQFNAATLMTLNFTNLDAQTVTGSRASRRPENTLNLSILHNVSERFSLTGSLNMVQDVVDNNNAALPDYELLNLGLRYLTNDNLKLHARLENATDEDYETVLGYGTPGRAFYVGVSSSF